MILAALSSDGEVSCVVANLIAGLEPPCGHCKDAGVTLDGTSPTGEPVAVRILPGHVLEVEGGGELLDTIRKRRCPYARQ